MDPPSTVVASGVSLVIAIANTFKDLADRKRQREHELKRDQSQRDHELKREAQLTSEAERVRREAASFASRARLEDVYARILEVTYELESDALDGRPRLEKEQELAALLARAKLIGSDRVGTQLERWYSTYLEIRRQPGAEQRRALDPHDVKLQLAMRQDLGMGTDGLARDVDGRARELPTRVVDGHEKAG